MTLEERAEKLLGEISREGRIVRTGGPVEQKVIGMIADAMRDAVAASMKSRILKSGSGRLAFSLDEGRQIISCQCIAEPYSTMIDEAFNGKPT